MKSIIDFLEQVNRAMDTIRQQPPVLAALKTVGYDHKKLTEGVALLRTAEARHRDFLDKYDILHVADESIDHAVKKAEKLYNSCSFVARIALEQSSRQRHALALAERRKRSFSGWVQQADTFFETALEDPKIKNTLTNFDVQPDKLVEGYAILQHVIAMKEIYIWDTEEVRQAAKNRDAALDELDSWLVDFQTAAEFVLKDYPDALAHLRFDRQQKLFR